MIAASINDLAAIIVEARSETPQQRALLVGISGIDGSGKGFITAQLDQRLRELDWNVAANSADDWLNLPDVCINFERPGEHFYEHAIRLDEMFDRLIGPLTRDCAIDLTGTVAGNASPARTGDAGSALSQLLPPGVNGPSRTSVSGYRFDRIDVVLLEGIFLFKPAYRDHFDLKIWIECSFETALQRAIARGQEGLPPAETKHAFQTIYFPAQRIHLTRDNPRETADFILPNELTASDLA